MLAASSDSAAIPTLAPAAGRPPILHIAGSRSAALRLRPVFDALAALDVPQVLCEAPEARAATIAALAERALARTRPAAVLLAGDGDAAVTAGLVATRLGVPIARLGAGLRCGDRNAPEEVNRLVLDGLANRLYTDGADAHDRLRGEGVADARIRCVGTTLSDVVAQQRAAVQARAAWRALDLRPGGYVLVSLQQPANVDDDTRVARITEALFALARRVRVALCLHPRTRAGMEPRGDLVHLRRGGVRVFEPVEHLDFMSLEATAGAVLTDSGSVQEETTLLGVSCFTLGRTTERTLTLTHGTNALLGDDPLEIAEIEPGPPPAAPAPIPGWDGRAGRRVGADLLAFATHAQAA
jgi:UDP-N-acetylglucosamine 2-epimerase (non-hydrolysing)